MSDDEDDFSSLTNPQYHCCWANCDFETNCVVNHQSHAQNHVKLVTQNTTSANGFFVCSWSGCHGGPFEKADELTLHVSFHAFHSKLMAWGLLYVESLSMREGRQITCNQDPTTKNHLPHLPEYLPCLWKDCRVEPFTDINLFFSHMEVHSNISLPRGSGQLFQCCWDDCKAEFSHRSHFKRHIRTHTQEKCISCPMCGSMFSSSLAFIDHLMRPLNQQIHHNTCQTLPALVCTECSLQFASRRLLDEHLKGHNVAIKCSQCDYVARGKGSLSRHVLYRHNTERKFACHRCSSSFKTSSDLRKHQTFHDEVSYVCAECNFEARSISVLNTHKRNVHGQTGDVYKCQLCEVKFQRAGSLTRHLSKQHVINLPEGRSRFKFRKYADGYVRAIIDWM